MRNRYLVAYDIADGRRLRLVHRCITGFGDPLQYSVFVCDLTHRELIALRFALRDIIDHRQDAILIVDLGPSQTTERSRFEFIGIHRPLPRPRGPTIV